jgi:hypothetical protein
VVDADVATASCGAGDPVLRRDPAGGVVFGAVGEGGISCPGRRHRSTADTQRGFERASGRHPPGLGGCARAGDERRRVGVANEDNSSGGV